MVLGLLRRLRLLTPCADGDRAAGHPLGTGRIERYVAPMRPLLEMRSQRSIVATSELDEHGGRLRTVPSRPK
jgi:hypothetical protein